MLTLRSIAATPTRHASFDSSAALACQSQVADGIEAILDALRDGIVECDVSSQRHLYVNAAFCRLIGLDRFEVFETAWPGPWWSPETARRLVSGLADLAAAPGGEPTEFDGVVLARDGHGIDVTIRMATTATASRRAPGERCLDHRVTPSVDNVVLGIICVRDRTHEREQDQALATMSSRVVVAEERERIARDLHDNAIQRLFATGLHLQSAIGRTDVEHRISKAIDEIDDIIREIRSTIFTLHRPRPLLEGAERALRSSIAEAERLLGHRPELQISGDLDVLAPPVVDEVLSVVREALSNVAKHAQASGSWVNVDVDDDRLSLVIEDDGIGYRQTVSGGNGVSNLVSRARALRGDARIAPRSPWGTRVEWNVPIDFGAH